MDSSGDWLVLCHRLLSHITRLPGVLVARLELLLSPLLAVQYRNVFNKWGRLDHLDTSIRYSRLALSDTPNHHPRLPHYQQRLASSLRKRFDMTGRGWDLYTAYLLQKSALATISPDNGYVEWHQNNLAITSQRLYSRLRKLEYVKAPLEIQLRVFSTLPGNHPSRAQWMSGIGDAYRMLYDVTGRLEDLKSSIHWATDALENTPITHNLYAERQGALANVLGVLAGMGTDTVDIVDRAIELHIASLERALTGTIDHTIQVMNLAQSYGTRYQRTQNPEDLEVALRYSVQGVREMPKDNPVYRSLCSRFNHIAARHFLLKYRKDRNDADLEESLRYAQDAERMLDSNNGSPHPAALKDDLAMIYSSFYYRFGAAPDLELAVSYSEAALALLPEGHHDIPRQQLHLSSLYQSRYVRYRDVQDLENALRWAHLARETMPRNNPNHLVCYSTLAHLYDRKVKLSRDIKDMDQALAFMQQAVEQAPQNDPDFPEFYESMASLYSTYYEYFGGSEAKNNIIKWMKMAVEAGERLGYIKISDLQISLASELLQKYLRLRDETDLQAALQYALISVRSTPDDHSAGLHRYTTLARIYEQQHALDHKEELRQLTMNTFRRASAFSGQTPIAQWGLAQRWTRFVDSVQSPESLEAYSYAFSILPAILWVGTNITTRHEALVDHKVTQLAANAVTSCVLNGHYEAAVEFLEQSLSITFNQLLDLQAYLSLLEPDHPSLAENLRKVSSELGELVVTAEETGHSLKAGFASDASNRTRKLAMERDDLLKKIRALPGFEHFLLPMPFSKLREASACGPVVMISCTRWQTDALIMINPNASVLYFRLHGVDANDLRFQQQRLQKALNNLGIHTRHVDRAGRVSHRHPSPEHTMLNEVLEWLWTFVVSPIYTTLQEVCCLLADPLCGLTRLNYRTASLVEDYGGARQALLPTYPCMPLVLRTHSYHHMPPL